MSKDVYKTLERQVVEELLKKLALRTVPLNRFSETTAIRRWGRAKLVLQSKGGLNRKSALQPGRHPALTVRIINRMVLTTAGYVSAIRNEKIRRLNDPLFSYKRRFLGLVNDSV